MPDVVINFWLFTDRTSIEDSKRYYAKDTLRSVLNERYQSLILQRYSQKTTVHEGHWNEELQLQLETGNASWLHIYRSRAFASGSSHAEE